MGLHPWFIRDEELNTDVELVAGDVNGTNFKRSLNLKLLFAYQFKHFGDASKW